MKTARDLFVTLLVLLLLATGIIALPFFLGALLVVFVAYVIYAIVHDTRIAKENKNNGNR